MALARSCSAGFCATAAFVCVCNLAKSCCARSVGLNLRSLLSNCFCSDCVAFSNCEVVPVTVASACDSLVMSSATLSAPSDVNRKRSRLMASVTSAMCRASLLQSHDDHRLPRQPVMQFLSGLTPMPTATARAPHRAACPATQRAAADRLHAESDLRDVAEAAARVFRGAFIDMVRHLDDEGAPAFGAAHFDLAGIR